MGNLLTILAVLAIALVIMVTLVERFGSKQSDAEVSKMSRYILPMVALMAVLQLVNHYFIK